MKAPPDPRKRPRQARALHTVEAILGAAARVLARNGYAATNTNLVAEAAGVSVGSLYQYFPNKDALIAALHERHGAQMRRVIDAVLSGGARASLSEHMAALIRAWLAAHMVEPELHRVLEIEFPFFDPPRDHSPTDDGIFQRVRDLLEQNRGAIAPQDRDLATWVVLRMIEAMVHAAIIDPPKRFATADIERAIGDAVMGYLAGPARAI